MLEGFLETLENYGLLGIFLVSFLGNTIPYSTVPYLVLVAAYAASLETTWDYLAVSILGGLGAGLGKVVVYYIGRTARIALPQQTRDQLERFAKLFEKSTFIAVFLFAALPLPDDLLYIPLGVARYNVWLFTLAVVTGKIVITGTTVFFGSALKSLVSYASSINPLLSLLSAAILTVVSILFVSKMNWESIIEAYQERGAGRALLELILQFFLVFVKFFRWLHRSLSWAMKKLRWTNSR